MVGYKRPPSIEKSQKVVAAFEAKVAILEEWGRTGVPEDVLYRAKKASGTYDGAHLPLDNAKLRRWRGPNGDLATWSDPLIDRPVTGKNPDLASRFQVAVENIETWLANKKGRLPALETRVQVLETENDRLRVQNAALLGENQQLKEDLALARAMGSNTRR